MPQEKYFEMMQSALDLYGAERWRDALAIFHKCLNIQYDNVELLIVIGNLYRKLGDNQTAVSYLTQANELAPQEARISFNIAAALEAEKSTEAAIRWYHVAIEQRKDFAEANNNLGKLYRENGNLLKGIAYSEIAVALSPNEMTLTNLGIVQQDLGRYEDAQKSYKRAIQINPKNALIRWNQGLIMLLHGELEKGWQSYWSGFAAGLRRPPTVGAPIWDGSTLVNKTVFISAEQGLGDEIMFASCLRDIANLAERCIVECEIRLLEIFEHSFPSCEIMARGSQLDSNTIAQVDYCIPVGALPGYFRNTFEQFPKHKGYLYPGTSLDVNIARRISNTKLNIGIAWSGGNEIEHMRRSTNLPQWLPIISCDFAQFFALQYGDVDTEISDCMKQFNIDIDALNEINLKHNINQVAAVICSLDLIITTSNAVAHIAGALGKPVWVLLPKAPNWRWFLDREDSPWYPSMRLFRQTRENDWEELIQRVKDCLIAFQNERQPQQASLV